MTFFQKIALKFIRWYQKNLSPDTGFFSFWYPYGYCKYNPTCSEFTYRAIAKYGILKGGIIGICRIIRCNPLSKGGNDPLF